MRAVEQHEVTRSTAESATEHQELVGGVLGGVEVAMDELDAGAAGQDRRPGEAVRAITDESLDLVGFVLRGAQVALLQQAGAPRAAGVDL